MLEQTNIITKDDLAISLWTSGTQEKVSIFSIEVCEQKSAQRTFLRQWWFWHTNIISTNCLLVLLLKWEFISYYVNVKLFLTSLHSHWTHVIKLIVIPFLNEISLIKFTKNTGTIKTLFKQTFLWMYSHLPS